MVTLKCDICRKEFLAHDDKEQFIVCDECKGANDELSNGKGGNDDEQQPLG